MQKARLEIFGLPPRPATVEVVDRSTSYRGTRALLAAAIGFGAAPVVFFLPLHFPWAAASIGIGLYVGCSSWKEQRTLVRLEGSCPGCDAPIRREKPERLRQPHALHCASCGRQIALDLDA